MWYPINGFLTDFFVYLFVYIDILSFMFGQCSACMTRCHICFINLRKRRLLSNKISHLYYLYKWFSLVYFFFVLSGFIVACDGKELSFFKLQSNTIANSKRVSRWTSSLGSTSPMDRFTSLYSRDCVTVPLKSSSRPRERANKQVGWNLLSNSCWRMFFLL